MIILPHPLMCSSNQSIIKVILYVSIHDSSMYNHAVMYNHVINPRFKGSQPFKQFIAKYLTMVIVIMDFDDNDNDNFMFCHVLSC